MHTMSAVAESETEFMFRCLACPRQVVIKKRGGAPVVIEEGEQVPHAGGSSLAVAVDSADLTCE